MNDRFSEELFLTNETGKMLYHKYAEHMPIIDYHCHLQPVEIAENKVCHHTRIGNWKAIAYSFCTRSFAQTLHCS